MAADFNSPVTTDSYVDVLEMLRANQEALARMFASGTNVNNIPFGAVRFEAGKFQSWNGSVWVDVPVSVDGGGTGAQNAADARVALGTNNAANLTTGVMSADRVPGLDASKIVSGTLTRNTTGNAATATYATSAGSAATAGSAGSVTNGVYTVGDQTIGGNKTFSSDITVNSVRVGRGSGNYNNNLAVGSSALNANTIGVGNTAVGYLALRDNTTGVGNTAVGYFALSTNTTFENITGLGNTTQVTGSNQVQLGNSSTTTYVYGTVQDRSDERDKADIRDTTLGLDFIKQLRPVDYRWDMRDDYRPEMPERSAGESDSAFEARLAEWREASKLSNIQRDGSKKRNRYHHGVIAQEVKQTIDSLGIDFGGFQHHAISGGEDVMSIGYDEFIAPLIKAVQELAAEVERLKSQNP